MTILVTGGAGYIGSHTVLELCLENHEVIVVDNLSNSSFEALRRVEKITERPITFYAVDCRNKSELNEIFAAHTIDAVIHFAGLKAVGESVIKPLLYYQNNLISTMVLLDVMQKHHVKTIVFSSSATVYGANHPSPLVETMKTEAINPYGETKKIIETILEDVCRADKEFSVSTLRYFNPVGAHPSGAIGEDPRGIPNNLMPLISQVAIGKRPYLEIYGDDYDTPDGTGIRDYIHVVDLAKGHTKALERAFATTGFEVYNLGRGQGISVKELINAFEKENNVTIPTRVAPRRPGDLAMCYADTEKAKKILNWEAHLSVEAMVKDAWRFQKNHPEGYKNND